MFHYFIFCHIDHPNINNNILFMCTELQHTIASQMWMLVIFTDLLQVWWNKIKKGVAI